MVGGIALGAAVVGSGKLAANFERAEVALASQLGSLAEARGLIDELRQISLRTTTDLTQELVPSAFGLLGVGVDRDEIPQLIDDLATLSIVTEQNGRGFQELTRIFARNFSQFRQTTRDIREFNTIGLNILPSLARQLGVEEGPELFKAIEEGRVSIDLVRVALNELANSPGFKDLQSDILNTASGQFEKLSESTKLLAITLGTRLLPAAEATLRVLNRFAAFFEEQVQTGGAVNETFATLSAGARGYRAFLESLTNQIINFNDAQAQQIRNEQILRGLSQVPEEAGPTARTTANLQRERARQQRLADRATLPRIDRFLANIADPRQTTAGPVSRLEDILRGIQNIRAAFEPKIEKALFDSLSDSQKATVVASKAANTVAETAKSVASSNRGIASELKDLVETLEENIISFRVEGL